MSQSLKDLDAATEKIQGDTATIDMKGEKKPMTLKKISGHWKVDASSMPELPTDEALASMKKIAQAMDKAADDVRSGKLKTKQQIQDAMQAAIK